MSTSILTAAQKTAKLQAIIAEATKYLGTQEDAAHTNHGKQVEAWLANVGLSGGNPWCMAFAVSMFESQGYLNVNGTQILIKTGSCEAQADHARSIGLLVSAADAQARLQPGWLMLQWEADLGRYAHTGIVTAYDPATRIFKTIEGNTNTDGNREGYEVARQTRDIRDVRSSHPRYAFIQTT